MWPSETHTSRSSSVCPGQGSPVMGSEVPLRSIGNELGNPYLVGGGGIGVEGEGAGGRAGGQVDRWMGD